MTHVENLKEKCFLELKPIGDLLAALSQTPMTRDKSKRASTILKALQTDLEVIQDPELIMDMPLITCVIIPLVSVYKSMTLEERHGYEIVTEPWLKVMHFILSKTLAKTLMPAQFTIQLIILFTNLISQFETNEKQQKSSEEIKYAALLCLSAALPAKYKEGRYDTFKESICYTLTQKMREENFVKIASPCVMALLDVIRNEQNIDLRLEAIQVLSQILLDNIYDIDLLALLLPGVVSKLCLTISQKGEKENHKILCSALYELGEIIKAVMCDRLNDTLVDINSFQDIIARNTKDDKTSSTEIKKYRSKEWYLKSKESLANVMEQILKTRLYPDWRTRLVFVEFAYTLLSSCGRTLDNCIKPLIEIMVLHTDDAYDEVSTTCRLKMQLLLSTSVFKDSIIPILKDELYQWIMKFPMYMISRDESEKSNAIALISGFIIILGEEAESVLSTVLSRTSDGWMSALEIDKDSLNILEEKQGERFIELKSDEVKSTPIYPKIRFKHVVTDLTTTKLTRLLNVIGKYCDLSLWISHFMRYISVDKNDTNDPQAAYIVHSLLSGAFGLNINNTANLNDWINDVDDLDSDFQEKMKIVTLQVLKETMDILTVATTFNGKSTAMTSKLSSHKLDEESGYVLTVCFGLQIVGLTACILDQDCLQDQLITILYPLLAHLGSSNVYIHTYALITLDAIALTCGLNNAQELAIQNIDYIINMISQHISVLSENPRVPLVLKALIHVCGYSSISYLDDSVLEIFDALDRYNLIDWLCIQLCGVLFEIIQTLERNLPNSMNPNLSEEQPESGSSSQVSEEIKSMIDNGEDVHDSKEKVYESMEEIGEYFLKRQDEGKHENLTLEQSIMDQGNLPMDLPTDDDKGKEEVASEEEKKIPLSKEEDMAKEIMDKSSLFLTASSPQLRSQMLVLLTSGISILSSHPQELNQLVFSMWSSIIHRFDDPQNYVVFQAAKFVEKLSEVSTDYLSRKFECDLWPRFELLLRKGTVAAAKDKISDYSIFSLYHRTQLCLMKTLTQIAKHVPMNQRRIKEILEEIKYYYQNDQVHQQLSNQCKALFDALSTQQPDTVWLYQNSLNDQSSSYLNTPSSALLDPFVIPEWLKNRQITNSNKLISI